MGLLKKIPATAAAFVLLASCIREGRPGGDIAPGDRLPDFVVEMNDGSLVSTASLEGSVSLIMFFNTGCPDCREELPAVQRIYDDFGPCVRIVCISREEGRAGIEAYWRENGLTLPYSAQEDSARPRGQKGLRRRPDSRLRRACGRHQGIIAVRRFAN